MSQCLCKAGYYGDTNPGEGNVALYPTLCQICKEDHYCPGGGKNLSVECPDGQYSMPGADNTSDCFCPQFSTSKQSAQGVWECMCNAGYYKVNSSQPSAELSGWACVSCSPGDYCYQDQSLQCPPHSTSKANASNYLSCSCLPGYTNTSVQTAQSLCEDCPDNYYCPGGGLMLPCTANAVSPEQSQNASACYCTWGWLGVNNTQCTPCGSPNYCYGGIEQTCPAGSSSSPLAWERINCTCNAGYSGIAGESQKAVENDIPFPDDGCIFLVIFVEGFVVRRVGIPFSFGVKFHVVFEYLDLLSHSLAAHDSRMVSYQQDIAFCFETARQGVVSVSPWLDIDGNDSRIVSLIPCVCPWVGPDVSMAVHCRIIGLHVLLLALPVVSFNLSVSFARWPLHSVWSGQVQGVQRLLALREQLGRGLPTVPSRKLLFFDWAQLQL